MWIYDRLDCSKQQVPITTFEITFCCCPFPAYNQSTEIKEHRWFLLLKRGYLNRNRLWKLYGGTPAGTAKLSLQQSSSGSNIIILDWTRTCYRIHKTTIEIFTSIKIVASLSLWEKWMNKLIHIHIILILEENGKDPIQHNCYLAGRKLIMPPASFP